MGQVINTNTLSLMTQNNLNKSQSALSTAIERLSSGLRINSAKDDAAGQAIANRFTSNINGLTQASRNANDGISVAQTTEGSLSEINNNLQRIRELSVQAANGTNSDSDLTSIQDEITSRLSEIDRVSGQTQFNGVNVLASNQTMKIQVGANDGQTIDIDLQKIDSTTLGLNGFSVSKNALKTSDAITQVGASGSLKDVNLSSAATSLGLDASKLSLKNVQTAAGAATATYVVSDGTNNYAASVDDTTGAVTLNTTDVSYTDTTNGVTAGTQTGKLVKVGADATGAAVGYVSVQGKDYKTAAAAIVDGGATGTANVASTIGDISDAANANAYTGTATSDPLKAIDAAIAKVDTFRSSLGAVQNRFDSAITNLDNTTTNLASAQSRIQDADYATEVSAMSKAQILQQAGTSVLSKANQVPQSVLTLLQG
ncbi:FliC/FljB family flagellin [Rahnella sp. Larv3_ips]|uniref:FliC/FljB family flagellin n=1 Tax=Rahnella sp. Larv3_ips TaxID=1896943 RepID=UPI000EFBE68E|nr:FliC/FljB family flagellin [Rahnella sp. Larv3_ips]THD42895.1 FliC/FljB family flagellin [Enterobacteriaceae bacterium ML5]